MEESLKIMQCPICGGEMEILSQGHYRCRYCRNEAYVKSDNSQLMYALNTAAKLRYRKDFAGAMEEYERAIELDKECSDAYWGMFLSEYGIEFVKDVKDNEYKPTLCHRVQNIAVKDNINYKKAINYANYEQIKEFEKQGESIERVRNQILMKTDKLPVYDIFICYKQNEDDGTTPTEESKWAKDLYFQLTGYGYKVFYAEESLADKAGEYEANIFSALNSAKVMLILGTSLEHINAVWVKNEWSRFVKIVKDNPNKSFKVILGSKVAPETLPTALRWQQSIRHDDLDWWDKVRSYLKTALENGDDGEASSKINVSQVAQKRYEEFENFRTQARKAREKVKVELTPEQIIAEKKKREALEDFDDYFCLKDKFSCNSVKRKHDDCLENLSQFADKDFDAARACLLLWAEDVLNRRIYDEATLMDFPLSFDCKWLKLLLNNCNEEEKKYYNKIVSVCQDNINAENKLKKIKKLLDEELYEEAIPFVQNIAAEHPTYQMCWVTLLKCKGIENIEEIVKTEEYHNLVAGLVDKNDNFYQNSITLCIQRCKEQFKDRQNALIEKELEAEKLEESTNDEILEKEDLIDKQKIFLYCSLFFGIIFDIVVALAIIYGCQNLIEWQFWVCLAVGYVALIIRVIIFWIYGEKYNELIILDGICLFFLEMAGVSLLFLPLFLLLPLVAILPLEVVMVGEIVRNNKEINKYVRIYDQKECPAIEEKIISLKNEIMKAANRLYNLQTLFGFNTDEIEYEINELKIKFGLDIDEIITYNSTEKNSNVTEDDSIDYFDF
ncbi:MAG: hypothetical protein ACI4MI_05345 [Christensenellales bacterium]